MFGYKLKIKLRMIAEDIDKPFILPQGDWIDVVAAKDIIVGAGESCIGYIPLGFAAELPKGFEAYVTVRSSSPKKKHIWCCNSFGIIDESFQGNDDHWHLIAAPIDAQVAHIKKNERIAQFRIQLSQKATTWQKLKWLFSDGVELVFVDNLKGENRGGIGSTDSAKT